MRSLAVIVLALGVFLAKPVQGIESGLPPGFSETTLRCLECHREDNPGLYQQWGVSKHYGANVGCYECHAAGPADADRLRDGIHDDFTIATLVTPLDCARCHEYEETAPEPVAELASLLREVSLSDNWKWSVNKEDPAVKDAREKRQREFLDRYK